jgi:hypothetical protein
MPHLAAELLKISAGIELMHVPYTGAAPVKLMFADIPVRLSTVPVHRWMAWITLKMTGKRKLLNNGKVKTQKGFPPKHPDTINAASL